MTAFLVGVSNGGTGILRQAISILPGNHRRSLSVNITHTHIIYAVLGFQEDRKS
jgi:hypothetical protein